MGLYRYTDDVQEVANTNSSNSNDCGCDHGCDSESAKALKRIISLLDDLNNDDLRLLDEIIDRLLCIRGRA